MFLSFYYFNSKLHIYEIMILLLKVKHKIYHNYIFHKFIIKIHGMIET